MAYEMKDGDFSYIQGKTEGKPEITLKLKIGGKEEQFAVWKKDFAWGIVRSGNIEFIKKLWTAIIKYTVETVRFYYGGGNVEATNNTSAMDNIKKQQIKHIVDDMPF